MQAANCSHFQISSHMPARLTDDVSTKTG